MAAAKPTGTSRLREPSQTHTRAVGRNYSPDTPAPEPPAQTTNRRRRPTREAGAPPELPGGGAGAPLPGAPCQEGARGSTRLRPTCWTVPRGHSSVAWILQLPNRGNRDHRASPHATGLPVRSCSRADTAPAGAGSACQHPGGSACQHLAEVPAPHPDPKRACRLPSPRSAYWSPRHCFQTLLLGTHSPEMPRSRSPRSSHPSPRHRKCLPSNSSRSVGSSLLQTRRKRQAIGKVMKERTLQNAIICPERWSLRIEGERKRFGISRD